MRVYVETNFVLELALDQEQCASCREILVLARSKQVELLVPAFCLSEPYAKLAANDAKRNELHQQLGREIRELRRSRRFKTRGETLGRVAQVLPLSVERDRENLDKTLAEMLRRASIIPFDQQVLIQAIASQKLLGLAPQDSIVYASVSRHASLATGDACFLNRDRHFVDPRVQSKLNGLHVRLIPSFDDGLAFVRHELGLTV